MNELGLVPFIVLPRDTLHNGAQWGIVIQLAIIVKFDIIGLEAEIPENTQPARRGYGVRFDSKYVSKQCVTRKEQLHIFRICLSFLIFELALVRDHKSHFTSAFSLVNH